MSQAPVGLPSHYVTISEQRTGVLRTEGYTLSSPGYSGVASMENLLQTLTARDFPDGSPLRVLVVDDHTDCAVSFAILLQLWGHEVQIAKDGPTALAAVQADKPHVVLLDLALPGMHGLEVARRIREIGCQPPLLIAVTGYGSDADMVRSAQAGIDFHLTKPVELDHLQHILKHFRRDPAQSNASGGTVVRTEAHRNTSCL
jgi:two-component system CheB/CheR fusion protein